MGNLIDELLSEGDIDEFDAPIIKTKTNTINGFRNIKRRSSRNKNAI